MNPPKFIELLIVVEVDKLNRIYCQADNCNHTVYKQIHVVRDNGRLTLYGSSCFKKKFHDLPTEFKIPKYSSRSSGSVLSDEERRMLTDNTELLLEIFRQEFEAKEKARIALKAKEKQENEHLLTKKNDTNISNVRIKNENWRRPTSYKIDSLKSLVLTNKLDESFFSEVRALETECKVLSPQFSEQQLMRSMWTTRLEVANNTIQEYASGVNRSQLIDVIIQSFQNGFRSDPWGFAVNLQLNYSIPKIVTFQVLSDFSLIRTPQIMSV